MWGSPRFCFPMKHFVLACDQCLDSSNPDEIWLIRSLSGQPQLIASHKYRNYYLHITKPALVTSIGTFDRIHPIKRQRGINGKPSYRVALMKTFCSGIDGSTSFCCCCLNASELGDRFDEVKRHSIRPVYLSHIYIYIYICIYIYIYICVCVCGRAVTALERVPAQRPLVIVLFINSLSSARLFLFIVMTS